MRRLWLIVIFCATVIFSSPVFADTDSSASSPRQLRKSTTLDKDFDLSLRLPRLYASSEGFIKNTTTAEINYTSLQLVGVHTLWAKYLRRSLRDYMRSDYDAWLDSRGHPVIAVREYVEMVDSYTNDPGLARYRMERGLGYGPASRQPLSIGNTALIFDTPALRVTNDLRLHVNVTELQVLLFGSNVVQNYLIPDSYLVESSNRSPDMIQRTRIGVSASMNKGVLTRASMRVTVYVRFRGPFRRYRVFPITTSIRYQLNTNQAVIYIRLLNMRF